MSSNHSLTIGTIGAGNVALAIAGLAVAAGHRAILSNSRGPESLTDRVDRLGPNASAGTVAQAARADIVLLAVKWDDVPAATSAVEDWEGRIVIDATNQWHKGPGTGTEIDLGDQTGSERNAALMPGARVVKAFNTIHASFVAEGPHRGDGRVVVFLAGDDTDAKATVSTFVDSLGFAPIDLGGVNEGRLMQVGGGPLAGLHFVKVP
jgi:predicted dinucleotide-binding enzyme